MINVTNRSYVYVRFAAIKFFFLPLPEAPLAFAGPESAQTRF